MKTLNALLLIIIIAGFTGCKKDVKTITPTNTVTDMDGNVYHTDTIGTQIWMTENLKVTKYRNGDPISNVTDNTAWSKLTTGAYCDYNNDANNSTTYGKLYNWNAVSDSRNIAPVGWHVASNKDWTTLITFLDGELFAGARLKEKGTSHWLYPNNVSSCADNVPMCDNPFLALPGGSRVNNGSFDKVGDTGFWWSSVEVSTNTPRSCFLVHDSSFISYAYDVTKNNGFSVRCVRD